MAFLAFLANNEAAKLLFEVKKVISNRQKKLKQTPQVITKIF
jgi:hypothetical protein